MYVLECRCVYFFCVCVSEQMISVHECVSICICVCEGVWDCIYVCVLKECALMFIHHLEKNLGMRICMRPAGQSYDKLLTLPSLSHLTPLTHSHGLSNSLSVSVSLRPVRKYYGIDLVQHALELWVGRSGFKALRDTQRPISQRGAFRPGWSGDCTFLFKEVLLLGS